MATPITSIGAAIFADLAFAVGTTTVFGAGHPGYVTNTTNDTQFLALFATEIGNGLTDDLQVTVTTVGSFARLTNVRDFPAIGAPANIVKVPTYGQKVNKQVIGQKDLPTVEVTVNYVPKDWEPVAGYGLFIGDLVTRAWRFSLLNGAPTAAAGATQYSSLSSGLGTAVGGNAVFYFLGRMEAIVVKPSLTDATTAVVTLSLQSDFYGAYSY
jgi:hypothetical protein